MLYHEEQTTESLTLCSPEEPQLNGGCSLPKLYGECFGNAQCTIASWAEIMPFLQTAKVVTKQTKDIMEKLCADIFIFF